VNESLLDRLSAHKTLSTAPPHEIAWIAAHCALRRLNPNDVLTSKNGPVEGLHVVLDGHLTIHVDRGAGPRKVMEWRGGDVTGVMPYSRIGSPPGDVKAEEPTEIVTVYRQDLPSLICDCPEVTAILVHVMVDRARTFQRSDLHDDKLMSLGKLAAGLAHEMNNPASAVTRSANALAESLMEFEAASRELGAAGLRPEQIAVAEKIRNASQAEGAPLPLSVIDQAEREESIERWLAGHKVSKGFAESLSNTSIKIDELNELDGVMSGPALSAAIRWLAASCGAWQLASEIHEASSRVSNLVDSIKGFTEMDRSQVAEPVRVEKGLSSTLVVLNAKARNKSIGINKDIESDLPSVMGFGGELNQVWANLIDNALDAAPQGGQVEISAARAGSNVVVRVVDNGSGIPPEVRERIFDPFFTTKAVGQGTGLGLDIVRRLVVRHSGAIEFDSRPGRTEFTVTLPAIGVANAGD
jgi:signal transduction histidine kinase